MKNILNKSLFILAAVLLCVSCGKDMEFKDRGVAPVTELKSPEARSELGLIDTPEANTLFSWTLPAANAAQSYYVAFYAAASGGSELARYAAEPTAWSIVISHAQLNRAAAEAGIAPEGTGSLYWTVISYRGGSEVSAATRNELIVTRYPSIEEPDFLYLGGTSEKEEDGRLRQFRNNGDGTYEIYAEFKADDRYFFTDRADEGSLRELFNAAGTLTEDGSEGSTPLDGLYRIKIDFTYARVWADEVTDVTFYISSRGDAENSPNMTYAGNGSWKWDGENGEKKIPTGDNRYRFKALVGGTEQIWGSNVQNSGNEPSAMDGTFYNIYIRNRGNIDPYNWGFKFMTAVQGAIVRDVLLNMHGRTYNHVLEFGDLEAHPVTDIVTPPALAASSAEAPYKLSENASAELTFEWVPTIVEGGAAPTFNVIFYKADGGTQTEIGRISGISGTSTQLSSVKLDELAVSAGAGSGETAELFWDVQTKVVTNLAMSASGPKKFYIERFAVPDRFFLTGTATEFGDGLENAREMTPAGDAGSGRFQLYTRLTGGTYNFVTANGGDPVKYTLSGSKLAIGDEGITATPGIYRITADVVAQSLVLEEITGVSLFFNAVSELSPVMEYVRDGQWTTPESFYVSDTGKAGERYRFNAVVNGVTEVWGYSRQNNSALASFTEVFHWDDKDMHTGLPAQYVYVKTGITDQWAFTFKAGRSNPGYKYAKGNHDITDFTLFMNGDSEDGNPHYHVTAKWVGDAAAENEAFSTHFATFTN